MILLLNLCGLNEATFMMKHSLILHLIVLKHIFIPLIVQVTIKEGEVNRSKQKDSEKFSQKDV